MTKHSSLHDRPNSFGWISIVLHWTTAIAIIVLWFIGQSISSLSADESNARRSLHITLGLVAWLPLAARIAWRLLTTHPKAVGQTRLLHNIARIAHTLMLATLSVMIISGPVMAWALPDRTGIADIALAIHSRAALLLCVLVVLHILAALKHLMFHDDETVARIFLPRRSKHSASQ